MCFKKKRFFSLFLILTIILMNHPMITTQAFQKSSIIGEEKSISVIRTEDSFAIQQPDFMKFLYQLNKALQEELIEFETPYLKITSLDTKQYKIIKGVRYHVLVDEYLEKNDPLNPGISKLTRNYFCYDGIDYMDVYPSIEMVAMDQVATIQEARKTLIINSPDSLKLPEQTLISLYVKGLWQRQYYQPIAEYHEKSLKDLTLKDLQEID